MTLLKKIVASIALVSILGTQGAFAYESKSNQYNNDYYRYSSILDEKNYTLAYDEFNDIVAKYESQDASSQIASYTAEKETLNKRIQNSKDEMKKNRLRTVKNLLLIEIDKLEVQKDVMVKSKPILNGVTKFANNSKTILQIQEKIAQDLITKSDDIFDSASKYMSYSQKGNSDFNFHIDSDAFISHGTGSFNNYTLNYNGLNSQATGDFAFSGNYMMASNTGVTIQTKALLDMISVDGNVYATLKNFNFDVNDENIKNILSQLQKKVEKDTYLKLPSAQGSEKMYEFLKTFDKNMKNQYIKNFFAKPLVNIYKVEGNKNYIVPSKYACEVFMQNQYSLTNGCSEMVYNKLIYDFTKESEVYFTDNGTTQTIVAKSKTEDAQMIATFQETLESFQIDVKEKSNFFKLNFQNKKSFSVSFKDGKETMYLLASLNTNNTPYKIDGKMNFSNLKGTISLGDENLQIKMTFKDYNTAGMMVMNGKISQNDGIVSLNGGMKAVDIISKKSLFQGNMSYQNNMYVIDISSPTFQGNFNGKITKDYFDLSSVITTKSLSKFTGSMVIDMQDNKYNTLVDLAFTNNGKTIFTGKATNTAQREYKKVEIKAPENFVEISEDELLNFAEYQAKKQQDEIRMKDLKTISTALDQYYTNTGKYPSVENLKKETQKLLPKFPQEAKEGEYINGCEFGYTYGVNKALTKYVVASCMESQEGQDKALGDGGLSDEYYEIGNGITDEDISLFFIEE